MCVVCLPTELLTFPSAILVFYKAPTHSTITATVAMAAEPMLVAVKTAVQELLPSMDLQRTSQKEFRALVARHMGLAEDGLNHLQQEVRSVMQECLQADMERKGSQAAAYLGVEDISKSKRAYLVTLSHTDQDTSSDGHKLVAPGSFTPAQIGAFFLAALAATQIHRLEPLAFLLLSVFMERHRDGHVHYHVPVLANKCFRFMPLKRQLLQSNGLATHWSCSHEGYASCIAYCYLPSPTKPMEQLDPSPWLWAGQGEHPRLFEACQAPITSEAWAKRRERDRAHRKGAGKGEGRCREVDLWPVIIRENIQPGPDCSERLMAYAKRCGGPMMVDFCFQNWDKLQGIVEKSWRVEKVEDFIDFQSKSRLELLEAATTFPCTCNGQWTQFAQKILAQNDIQETDWCGAIFQALKDGRAKGNLVCHAGLHGNEGKSFLFRPLPKIFGPDAVFVAPPARSSFPLMGLEKARMAWLDDWRFNEDTIPYSVQLLWFEGAPFVIARPQNHFSGHLRYSKDDPVFITTLQEDLTALKGKRFLKQGDVDMMLKRLKVFTFTKKICIPKAVVPGCACCCAAFILRKKEAVCPVAMQVDEIPSEAARCGEVSVAQAESWTVAQVSSFLQQLSLGHLAPIFEENGIDGQLLCELSQEDLMQNLGLKPLQARKVMSRLWA